MSGEKPIKVDPDPERIVVELGPESGAKPTPPAHSRPVTAAEREALIQQRRDQNTSGDVNLGTTAPTPPPVTGPEQPEYFTADYPPVD